MNDEVLVVLPAYNEADIIGDTIDSLKTVFDRRQILVVNDGSTDDTSLVAEKKGIRVIGFPENRGKGEAMNLAWQTAPSDIYLFIDADLGRSAEKMLSYSRLRTTGFVDTIDFSCSLKMRKSPLTVSPVTPGISARICHLPVCPRE